MKNFDSEEFEKSIRHAIKPNKHELQRDLWPRMLSRLQPPAIRVPWFDWVLAAIVAIVCLLIPETLGGLLFHL